MYQTQASHLTEFRSKISTIMGSSKIDMNNSVYSAWWSTNLRRKKHNHCVKSVQMRSFFWSVFSSIWTEYGEIRSIQSECGKIRTRKSSVLGHFSCSECHNKWGKVFKNGLSKFFSRLLNTLSQISQAYKKKEKEKQKENHKLW